MEYFKNNNEFTDKISITQVDSILSNYSNDKTRLLNILLDIQSSVDEHYIPSEVAHYIADKLDIKLTQIYDVISFFSSLSQSPRAKYPIQVCSSIVCKVNDNHTLFENLKAILKIDLNEATSDNKFYLEEVPCFGACDIAPAIRVNGKVYGHLTSKEKVIEVLKTFV
ncbi:MAG: NAD(P)H-dependent oxidoreductase subunit E [Clostridium sp.]